jgi:hypothetical protein
MTTQLTFYGWSRPGAAEDGTSGVAPGRLQGKRPVTLSVNDGQPDQTRDVTFLLMGPGDVRGLRPGAIRSVAPTPGDPDAETDYAPHVEFASPDLPWRYSPDRWAKTDRRLKPWIVLVVGTVSEILLEPEGTVTLLPTVTAEYNLAHSARWAHVQGEGPAPIQPENQARVSRILSERPLQTGADYLAVVVPAFNKVGGPSWTPGQRVTVPAYHWWQFSTAPDADSFADLARKLDGIASNDPAVAGLGFAPLSYPTPATALTVRGALAPIGSGDPALPATVAADLAGRRTLPKTDPRGRPIISLPEYGDAWVADADATGWGAQLNADPRHRGVAGLGSWAGVILQEEIASAAADRAGALFLAAAKIRGLTLGLAVSGSLWERRLPTTRGERLLLFGPSFQRMPTTSGTVLSQVSDLAPERPLPGALLTSAAARVLRPGTALARHASPGALDPDAIFKLANACPEPPARSPAGLPHGDNFATWLEEEGYPSEWTRPLYQHLDEVRADPSIELQADPGEILPVLGTDRVDWDSVRDLIEETGTRPPDRPCRPVDLAALDDAIRRAVDPRGEDALVRRRVRDLIHGLDDEPLAPTEFCPDFDLPGWRVLRDHAPDWLLPGAGKLPMHRVVALETNLAFSDAFLVGLNTQALGELRWRNIPIRGDCTPLRRFWERVDPGANTADQDIRGIAEWPTATSDTLGSLTHVPVGSPGENLVLVFHTPLFRRYPGTLVYLFPAGGPPLNRFSVQPDLEVNPAQRIFPTYQAEIQPEYPFFCFPVDADALMSHWVVVEEVQRGYRFYNRGGRAVSSANADGSAFARAAFVEPTRVIIQGTELLP